MDPLATVGADLAPILISLLALVISAGSFWHTALRPAEIVIDPLEEDVSGSGSDWVPSLFDIALVIAISNEGARAGLLTWIDVTDVRAPGYPEFATGATARRQDGVGRPVIIEVGRDGELSRPITIDPHEVRALRIRLALEGALRTAADTTPTPNGSPIAEGIRRLERVEIEISWTYRRRGAFTDSRRSHAKSTVVTVNGETFLQMAIEFWDREGFRRLAGIARGGDGG